MLTLADATINLIPSLDLNLPPHPTLTYTDFSSSINYHPFPPNTQPGDTEIFEWVTHPYNAEAFKSLLDQHQLTDQYSLLVDNLNHGFPIGNMPILKHTVIIDNHPSVADNLDVVYDYIATELDANRMSGPFSQSEAERILRGPFYCSPFIVATQDQGPLLPPKKRVCRNLSKGGIDIGSVNSYIDTDDFPTRFDMASRVADAVSLSL